MHFWHIGPTEYAAISLPLYDAMCEHMQQVQEAQERANRA